MFTKIREKLFKTSKESGNNNAFINAAKKESAYTRTGNDALAFSEHSDDFVTQFTSLGIYRKPREPKEIFSDISKLWNINPELAVKFTIFMRLITRRTKLFDGKVTETVQRGSGLKHESIMRMLWISVYHPETFKANLPLFVAAGSWRDVFEMLRLDYIYNGVGKSDIDRDFIYQFILAGLENPEFNELVKKYLPSPFSKNKAKTVRKQANYIIVKELATRLFQEKNLAAAIKAYRKLKTSGTAHEWQKLISQGRALEINFDTVAGRALAQMVSTKFLENQGLVEKFEEWMSSKPVAKFTGYPFELINLCRIAKMKFRYQEEITNKQFMQLVETAKEGANSSTGLIVAGDTSGSMDSTVPGTNVSALDVMKSLALFFSYMLPEGPFANHWIEFNDDAWLREWVGSTPIEKWKNEKSRSCCSTNVMAVIDLLINVKRKGVDESQFPSGIVFISDGEFNKYSDNIEGIFAKMKKRMRRHFSPEFVENFKLVLWDIPNGYYGNPRPVFHSYENVPNVYYFSGFDGSILAFLTGIEGREAQEPKNATELFQEAMNQEILERVYIAD